METREIAALGHEYADGICTRCGEMQPLPPTDSSCFTFTELDDGSYAVAWNRTTELPREVVIPWEYDGKPVTQIASSAFEHCENLTSVTIPDSVTSIGDTAFNFCYLLESITIPSSVTEIGDYAFYLCTSLTSVTIPEGVTSIGEGVFSLCDDLTSLTVAEGNPVYHSAGNCIIETASKTLVAGCKASVIPADGSLTSIGEYAFFWCTNLINISIPGGVTSIGYQAFAGCENLQSVSIPSSVTSIGNYAFYGCIRLETLSIPSSITSIGKYAFNHCDNLTSVVFEEPDGWSAGSTAILSEDLADPATAAEYLVNMYWECIWTRE